MLFDLHSGGLLNLNKPKGLTSFGAVRRVRNILGVKRVGHCGTLDPMAEGVLLILFGKACSLQESLMSNDKTYSGEILLGVSTDTGDVQGKIIERKDPPALRPSEVEVVFRGFVGDIEQIPPMYSAVKKAGRPLYKYARSGLTVERASRTVSIRSFELTSFSPPRLGFRVRCSKGTYVRTLAEDAGRLLGTVAALSQLVRERSGTFRVEDSFNWNVVQEADRESLLSRAVPFDSLKDMASCI